MTGNYTVAFGMALLLVGYLLASVFVHGRNQPCMLCGKRGRHETNCPWKGNE